MRHSHEQPLQEKRYEGVFPLLKLLCYEMLLVLLVLKSKAAKFCTSLLWGTGCHALSAAACTVLMQLSHFFPLFFFLIEPFSAPAGRALAPNTIVTIKNNIKKTPKAAFHKLQCMEDLAGGGLGSAGEQAECIYT